MTTYKMDKGVNVYVNIDKYFITKAIISSSKNMNRSTDTMQRLCNDVADILYV